MDSKTVFELRNEAKNLEGITKLNKLIEALTIAKRLFSVEPYDTWIQKAFAYTLIDLSKYYISNKNINQAGVYYNQLLSIDFQNTDDIIESQKNFLRPKIDINYSEVQKAEEFSKSGNHIDALNIFQKLISENRLTEIHHEAYGWIIYRFVKYKENELTSIQVRTFLKDYMNLKNERPSILHSTILNFALHYSKDHIDFNLYNFFKLWNPKNLRFEDKNIQNFNGKEIPSLVSRIYREFIEKDSKIDIVYLITAGQIEEINDYTWETSSPLDKTLDLLREPFFWKIFKAHKESNYSELWSLFNKYNQIFSKYEKSKWHSEILNLAERFMQENEEWQFLDFFKNWNPQNLRGEDWKEVKKDDKIYKPLAIKCLKKVFDIIKTQNKDFTDTWLFPIYANAVKLYSDDEWLLRENALLFIKNNELESAIEIYRNLVLDLGDKSYIWNEFSSCFKSDNELKIGMLSKAIQLEKNEDFLGDIHLELARAFFEISLIENCIVELNSYQRHRELKGWRLSELYNAISEKTKNHITALKDNISIYNKYIFIAEEYAYKQIEWTELILVDKWKSDEGKERNAFTNGKTIDFSTGSRRFELLKLASLGNVFKFKLHRQQINKVDEAKLSIMRKPLIAEYKFIPLIVEKSNKTDWSILNDIYATIDYVNVDKDIVHGITSDSKEVFFPQDKMQLQVGDFVIAKYYTKKLRNETRTELREIKKIDKEIAVISFPKIIVIIDSVNKEKNLFHFVGNKHVQGIIRFTETDIIPDVGKFLEISFASKLDKKQKKIIFKAIAITETEKINPNLIETISGKLELKYKRAGRTIDFFDLDENEMGEILPDFGFVGDFYVPKNVLCDNQITTNCNITATAIFSGDKWKIIKLDKV